MLPTKIIGRGLQALTIHWNDGSESVLPVERLRRNCPCAGCDDLRKNVDPLRVLPAAARSIDPARLIAERIDLVGSYAIQIRFSDGHDTGIFTFEHLHRLAAPPAGSG
ncbi:MAG TPA: DUF971 domain-containing protein [Acidobacteriota bacterium]